MRPSWDDYFMGIAQAVATRANCSRRRIGAVVVDADRRIVSTGYNGAPAGDPGCLEGACPRAQSDTPTGAPYDNCTAVHAETNALLYAGRERTVGATLYVTGVVCHECTRLIKAAGIERVVTP